MSFVSAKGGSGKTILSATTAYTLLQAGMKVVTIDTDFSTRGLSLYLLGSVLESNELIVQSKHCLFDSVSENVDVNLVTPLKIMRGQIEYHVVISNKDVWRGGVPSEATMDPLHYFNYLHDLCERFRDEYDYIIMDTRGGYDFTSAAPATISDGYIVVVEADKVSVEQVSGFIKKMDEFADSPVASFQSQRNRAKLKGFIINKAIFSVDEQVFPQALAREYGSKTFGVIPMDRDAIRAYQLKSIPQEAVPDSDFSYHSLRAIEHVISPSINWSSSDNKRAFYKFSKTIYSGWRARKIIDLSKKALIPHFIIVLMVMATIFYMLFKKGSISYALPAFLLCTGLFALFALLDAMLGSLGFLRSIEMSRRGRLVLSAAMFVLLVGFSYLALFDLPRTFSQEPLIKRIEVQDVTIAHQRESLAKLEDDLTRLQTEKTFLSGDLGRAQETLIKARDDYSKLQSQSLTLRSQNASLQRDKDSVDAQLQSAQAQASRLNKALDECFKRPR
jgi:cellulose biosynthesis protein BcsQ